MEISTITTPTETPEVSFFNIKKERYLPLSKIEEELLMQYSIRLNLVSRPRTELPLRYINPRETSHCSYYIPDNRNFMYSANSIMIIFPEQGIRLSCTIEFAKSLSVLSPILEGVWQEKLQQIEYMDVESYTIRKGPYIYITSFTPEMFCFTNSKYRVVTEIHPKTYKTFKTLGDCMEHTIINLLH
jgi:hypothetical protein